MRAASLAGARGPRARRAAARRRTTTCATARSCSRAAASLYQGRRQGQGRDRDRDAAGQGDGACAARRCGRQGAARRSRRHVGVDAARRLDDVARPICRAPTGPAQLAEDGRACCAARAKNAARSSSSSRAARPRRSTCRRPARGSPAPAPSASSCGPTTSGVWTAPPGNPKQATKVAPEAPLRGFLPSPDGAHALGVYAGRSLRRRANTKKPAEVLMMFPLDGQGARARRSRTACRRVVARLEVGAGPGRRERVHHAGEGGQYKCWRGYTAASLNLSNSPIYVQMMHIYLPSMITSIQHGGRRVKMEQLYQYLEPAMIMEQHLGQY